MTQNRTTRREVLVGAGGVLAGISTVPKVNGKEVNRPTFIRGIPHYELQTDFSREWRPKITAVDLPRILYNDGNKAFVPEQANVALKQGQFAIQKPGSPPQHRLRMGESGDRQPISGIHHESLRPVSLLHTKGALKPPKIDIIGKGEAAIIPEKNVRVEPGQRQEVEAESFEVQVKVEKLTNERKSIPQDIPEDMDVHAARRRKSEFRTAKLKPIISVKNFGELQVKQIPITKQ